MSLYGADQSIWTSGKRPGRLYNQLPIPACDSAHGSLLRGGSLRWRGRHHVHPAASRSGRGPLASCLSRFSVDISLSMLFITGSTGFIGGALAARLIETAHWQRALFLVRAADRAEGRARLADNLRLHGIAEEQLQRLQAEQIICGDLTGVSRWIDDPRLAQVEDVVNSAALASFGNHRSIFPTNVEGVLEMAHGLMRRRRLRRFIQIGTGMSCGRDAPRPVSEDYRPAEDVQHYLDYTASKHEAEQRLQRELPDLPLVIARPSIVVGHTRLGCAASGSIYWVFRLARALQAFPCELDQKIDVIPVDYCAEALQLLLEKPTLKYSTYHISSGQSRSCTFGQIDEAISLGTGQKRMSRYRQTHYENFLKMQDSFKDLIGPCNKRIVLKAIRSYGYFAAEEVLFDNSRLIEEGMMPPEPLINYVNLCEKTSKDILISQQMKYDYKT